MNKIIICILVMLISGLTMGSVAGTEINTMVMAAEDAAAKAGCVWPYSGMVITQSTTFCYGTYNIPGTITIQGNSVTVDCSKATLMGGGKMIGTNINGLTVKNCNTNGFGMYFTFADRAWFEGNNLGSGLTVHGNNTVVQNNVLYSLTYWKSDSNPSHNAYIYNNYFPVDSSGDHKIYLWRVHDSLVYLNTIAGVNNEWGRGISLDGVYNTEFNSNTVQNGDTAVYCWCCCFNDTFAGNTISGNRVGVSGIFQNSKFYMNNFVSNKVNSYVQTGDIIYGGYNALYYNHKGNYYSNFDSANEGCVDSNADSRCDYGYNPGTNYAVDYYPWTTQSGWLPWMSCGTTSSLAFCQKCYAQGGYMNDNSDKCSCSYLGTTFNPWTTICPPPCDYTVACDKTIVENGVTKWCRNMGSGGKWISAAEAKPYCDEPSDIGNKAWCNGKQLVCDDTYKWPACGASTACTASISVKNVTLWCRNFNNEGWKWLNCAKCNGIGCASYPTNTDYPVGTKASCASTQYSCKATGWVTL